MAKFVFVTRGEVRLVDQRRDSSPGLLDPVQNAKAPLRDIHLAERILWIDIAGSVWLVKDRFAEVELPLQLL